MAYREVGDGRGYPIQGQAIEDNFRELFSVRWEDLRFPAQGINPAGATAAPSVDDVLTDFPGTLLFSGTVENVICGVAQLPHAWQRGTSIKPHIHWAKTSASADTVDWRLYYRITGNPGDAPAAWSAAQSPTTTIGDHETADEHLLTAFPAIALPTQLESCMLSWRLHRLGNTDAFAGTARLHELDFHFQIDKQGTETEIPA